MQSRSSKDIKGIDISKWQTGIDYKKVRETKEVVIIKATEGVDFVDSMFERHYIGCKESGFKIGFYHFFSDKTNPTEQARDFWNAIKGKQLDVLPVLDVETSIRSKTEVTNRCLEFLQEMKRLSGYDCIVYTYTSFAIEKLDSRLAKYPLWIAHYGVSTPGNNGIWNSWVGFQYTDKEWVPGVPNPCDADDFTEEIFIGTRGDNYLPFNTDDNDKLWKESISGQLVKELQMELNRQFNKGLKIDGYFGENTLNACILVRRGAKGNITKIIQERLLAKGYDVGIYGSDGVFGPETKMAVKKFQKNYGLQIDGIVGKETWKALFRK
ncbi:peptidoglycan-binding protein [Clostridium botulinum]|uniref:Glycosyl hydrolase n=1 Tax=Clostridium botulinum C/D str. DC5 TaxID=1443128 RepID=A0A0A0IFZ7_CLOBO|nr:GH25 family lysozyme [Clostridium botulinum]KEI00398.1 glycosyl hydrolase [Clostridium botulinum C/D str. BKT75002]KEI12656.1 glycosyl hydrolase [Clostridium botulinum C/D str. BKT2873]KGM95217.1 glycosyl hydrolase [Clostridium botulinum D str. CCUG 7971]KGM99166.1 glycosyl hydrolase [Clostridium botulinum C/D str. DC5]KOC46076.1 glycosyl hydrolase [Clostridium botulinum]